MIKLPLPNANQAFRSPPILLATWFGAGLMPKAPGTWGSLAALPFAWAISANGGQVALLIGAVFAFGVGWWASNVYLQHFGGEDPGPVVIDEVAGQWLTLAAVAPDPVLFGVGFGLFRLVDIYKPWPVSWADQKVKAGLGIMLDDILAALYAGAGLYLVNAVMIHGGWK